MYIVCQASRYKFYRFYHIYSSQQPLDYHHTSILQVETGAEKLTNGLKVLLCVNDKNGMQIQVCCACLRNLTSALPPEVSTAFLLTVPPHL